MSATSVLPSTRSELDLFLKGDELGRKFHELFESVEDRASANRKKNEKKAKKSKVKGKDKKSKRDASPDDLPDGMGQIPSLELCGNPSSFNVYSLVRQALLERCMKEATRVYQRTSGRYVDTDSDEEGEDRNKENNIKIPKIVGLGLRGVFEIVRETRDNYPQLCIKAMKALLDMLQGQQPESMKYEPTEIIDGLFQLLMEIATNSGPDFVHEGLSLTSLACSGLISLVIALGDTGKLLTAVSAMLMSTGPLSTERIKVPGILTSLQKSVQAVLLGKTQLPDWFSQGVKGKAQLFSFKLDDIPTVSGFESSSITAVTSDGQYLYVHNKYGLFKIGSGYGGTSKGHIYCHKEMLPAKTSVWLAFARDILLCRIDNSSQLCMINTDSLEVENLCEMDGHGVGPCAMFCDGEHIGQITAAKDDSFVVRMFDPRHSPMEVVSEIPLKLTRKCLDAFGQDVSDPNGDSQRRTVCTGFDEDIAAITSGKEFMLVKTTGGKVLYAGKSTTLGIKQGGPSAGKWAELPITKSPKVAQVATGHDGQHALIVGEDGATFFVGTPRRGEDGDTSLSKGRRQPKAVKPKKMIRLDSKFVVFAACNNGSSAVITKDGGVYMFGKDTAHCHQASGHVTDLKDQCVVQICLGKAHAVALTSKGSIFTFGINNKGQCGRDFNPGAVKDVGSHNVNMTEEEEEVDMESIMCPPGKHKWKLDQCMVCFVCGECTGYGMGCINSSINSGRGKERNPGMPCGCGAGEAGCTECGACKTCAGLDGEDIDELKADLLKQGPPGGAKDGGGGGGGAGAGAGGAAAGPGGQYDLAKELVPLNLIMGGGRDMKKAGPLAELFAKLERSRSLRQKNQKVSGKSGSKHRNDGGSDQEAEYSNKIVSLPPTEVTVGTGEVPISQIACGMHHTVVLLQNGEVYTFGSNQYGQLGLGDTTIRGGPTRVPLPSFAQQVAAGSHHTVILLINGQVLTCGNYQKGSLGRVCPEDGAKAKKGGMWYTIPGPIPGVGARYGRRATWIGASGDQTFMRIDESLINAHILSSSKVFGNQTTIGLIPMGEDNAGIMKCLMINKVDGNCRSFGSGEQVDLATKAVCLDPVYDVLWSFNQENNEVTCYNVIAAEARSFKSGEKTLSDLFKPELSVSISGGAEATRSHCALHVLGCLDTLTVAKQSNLVVLEEAKEKTSTTKVYTKDDFSTVNRFESHGGGWGYSGHSIEAIRFMCDTDVMLGGFGLFGGRGEYYGRIKLFELGPDGGENEGDGEVLAESEEVSFECGAREKYPMLFDEPVLLQANSWYVAWSRISGPSSDCGSSGVAVVTTEDQVVFKFKGSKKSNNGTDVNAGQIPQLLYRLPSRDNTTVTRKSDSVESAHVLSPEFSCSVSPESFEALLKLLEWSWNTFHSIVQESDGIKGNNQLRVVGDLTKLVYICRACLRLLKIYVTEVYPDGVLGKHVSAESTRVAECVGSTQDLLRRILAEEVRPDRVKVFLEEDAPGNHVGSPLVEEILNECHLTFRSCFHAFYPTGTLKWLCLCDLLHHLDPSMLNAGGYGRLLAAIMEAMCHPTIKLTGIMPINCEPQTEEILRKQSIIMDDNTNSVARLGELHRFPLLVDHMTTRIESSGVGCSQMSFKDVLERLLMIVSYPVRQSLVRDTSPYPDVLVANTCSLLATIISELAATATGLETDVTSTSRPMLVTPNRFTRTSQTAFWNTGNGSPDAIELMVDKAGIVIAGVCLYGGEGVYNYEVELLDEQSSGQVQDPSHTQRWNSIEIVKGSYGPDDTVNDIAEIKFDRPIPIKEGVKYAIRLRNDGFSRTLNGDGGISKVKCPDGTTFTFTACSLSSNGTNHMRGQVPQILYYSAPQEGEQHQQNNKNLAELQARKNAIDIASAICRVATDLLQRANSSSQADVVRDTLGASQLFRSLLPLCLAYIGPVASQDPRGAVQVLSLIQEILPAVANLINQIYPPPPKPESGEISNGSSGTQHYAILESDHPYKPATVANYKVTFPESVKWMVLEFDAQCGTAQPEDTLQLFVPAYHRPEVPGGAPAAPTLVPGEEASSTGGEQSKVAYWPILKKFHGTNNWPKGSVVIPSNEVIFSLETASDYVKDEKACFFGFKCFLIGYEWKTNIEDNLRHLEKELSYLGGMCAASLVRRDIVLPPVNVDELDEDMEYVEEGAQLVFGAHSQLLGKGFALSRPPTIMQALEGSLPFCWQSNERSFLKDFVSCTMGTSGGRLARWLQPNSYVDPKQCEILYNKEDLKCSWPNIITVLTKDQYGQLVHTDNLKVEVKAVPVDMDPSGDDYKRMRRLSRPDEGNITFGGHPPPNLDTPYEVTVKDKKDAFHAICMMKAYENYSFEELRYAAPAVPRPSENMLVRSNDDGTYSANWTPSSIGFYNIYIMVDGFEADGTYSTNWTPSSIGFYNIYIMVDGFEAGDVYKVEVKEPPQGVTPPSQSLKKQQRKQMRRFVAKNSAGLRVRTNPSLQSEQIGIIQPEGIISYMDEVHNDDGVWLRLSPDSIKEWCHNGFTDAWALQYNQHLGKTLLVPLDEPKSIIDEILSETMRKIQTYNQRPTVQPVPGGPGVYEVVKCGSFGHNIRSRPNLKATAVGRVEMGNQIAVNEELVNGEGTWVKLDSDSVDQFCQTRDADAWTLAKSRDGTAYLLHESQLGLVGAQDPAKDPFAFNSLPPQIQQGFDFRTPSAGSGASTGGGSSAAARMQFFGSGLSQDSAGSVFGGRRSGGQSGFAFGNYPGASSSPNIPSFGMASPSSSSLSSYGYSPGYEGSQQQREMQRTHSLPSTAFLPRSGSPSVSNRSPAPGSPKFSRKETQASAAQDDLQALSVKDLVKALGEAQLEHIDWSNLDWLLSSRSAASGWLYNVGGKEIRTQTRAISPKKLAQIIGESQANGNGPTPVPSPPGSPKKSLSRSSSPQMYDASQGNSRSWSPSGGRSASPRQSFSPHSSLTPEHSASSLQYVTPPSSPLATRRGQLKKEASIDRPSVSPPDSPLVRHVGTDSAPLLTTVGGGDPTTQDDTALLVIGRSSKDGSVSPRFSSPGRLSPQGSPRRASSPHVHSSPSRASSGSPSITGPDGVKIAFNIGAANKEEAAGRLSPKTIRKDRGRQLRSKRERAASPASQRDMAPVSRARAFSASMIYDRPKAVVKKALSPSVAEALRAVFAAFVWHEGIVHDAMACASFLKFNPNLSKDMSQFAKTSKKTEKQRVRHATDSSKDQHKQKDNTNINEPRVRFKLDPQTKKDGEKQEIHSDSEKKKENAARFRAETTVTFEHFALPEKSVVQEKEPVLPTTLQHLVYFWEEMFSATERVIFQELIYPSPSIAVKGKKPDKKDDKKDKDKKGKKKKEAKQYGRGGNLFADAMAGIYAAAGGDRETVCELCGGMFPHPVTYHMRQSHPGCGRHAGGKGYNSGGNFCGGWAGNCGEGGVGGSSWYLICDKCREKYLKEKRHAQKEKDKGKKLKKKNSINRQQNMLTPQEPHIVLKNNAMFLLDLASASGFTLPVQSLKKQTPNRGDLFLPSVSEEYRLDLNPFPSVPFQFLIRQSAQSSDSAFADDFFIDADERVFVRSGSLSIHKPTSYRPRLPTEPRHSPLARSGSLGKDARPLSTCIPPTSPQDGQSDGDVSIRSAGTSPESDQEGLKKSGFHRSISEIVSDDDGVNAHDKNLGRLVSSRRRNNSGGVGDGGTLLKHPSAAMTKLITSVDKKGGSSSDKTLNRPVMAFIIQRHDLEGLQLAMKQALRKATCRVFSMQALNWLLRSVTQSVCIHDLLWFFVSALSPTDDDDEEEEGEEQKDGQKNDAAAAGAAAAAAVVVANHKEKKDPKKEQEEVPICDHPLADITIAGKAVDPLPETFHTLLQSIADVTMSLPVGSVIQQMALRCFCLKFRQADHQFLHESHVFSNISQILSKSDELLEEANGELQQTAYKVVALKDLTPTAEIKASSRQAMIASLTDNSTETFWESGDEDRNKLKTITIICQGQANPRIVYVHVDNTRDLGSKVTNITFSAGPAVEDLKKITQVDVDTRHIGWLNCPLPEEDCKCIQLSLRGTDHSLRVRQVKVLGDNVYLPVKKSAGQIQQLNCEAETLKVFRLLTSQVFGRLIDKMDKKASDTWDGGLDGDPDLKEHMVGILFSRSGKLTHLQKQVCAHIVQGIKKETMRVREEWEASLLVKQEEQEDFKSSDMFCFELLSMVSALSGSGVGREYLAQQYGLLKDLFSLLHTASPRVQRQVLSVLRRVLPDVKPQTLANILSIPCLPPVEYSIVSLASRTSNGDADGSADPQKPGILDVFLACIAKALTVQMKVKMAGPNKGVTSLMSSDCLTEQSIIRATEPWWWLRGRMTSGLAASIISLIQDMATGSLSDLWTDVTKAAIAEAILSLTKLDESVRIPQSCIRTPTLWLALASLCVLNHDHVDRLTSGEWVSSPNGTHGQPRPTCDNHDDAETPAVILCADCGNLCADCDRFLHLHRSKRSHQRQVFKEEEEAIKVDLHEGCGRTKLFWIMALADSKTLKAMVEFREGKGKTSNTPGKTGPGTCRFCGTTSNTGLLAIGNVCAEQDCQEYAKAVCSRTLSCGHLCGGIKNEESCLPCLHRCRADDVELLKQDADDMCMICFTEALSAAPAILLKCGHVFHLHCTRLVLEKRWVGPRITFGFSLCPICKCSIEHPVLHDLLKPIQVLFEDVRRKALMRLEYEGLHKAEAITTPGARFYKEPAGFAIDRYAYYVCFKCKKAYYGGEARCDEQAGGGDVFDPRELVCGGCSDVAMAQMCPKHGTDFLEYKCRYCCSVAVFFCFGTTHFCNPCHDHFQQVTSIPRAELPRCPCGARGKQLEGDECPLHVKHPPTGEEFALGCGVCRNAHTF